MEKCKVIVKKIGTPAEATLLENTYEAKKEEERYGRFNESI